MDKKRIVNFNVIYITIFLLLLLADMGLFYRMIRIQQNIKALNDIISSNSNSDIGEKLLEIGSQAPTFKKTAIDNNLVELEGFGGDRLLLVFASTGCPACQAMFPNLREFLNADRNFNVLMVVDGQDNEIENIIVDYGFNFPIIHSDEEIRQSYKVIGVPLSYFIDENGFIINASFANTVANFEELISIEK